MLKSNSIDSLKYGVKRPNKLPALNINPNLISLKKSYLNNTLRSKRNNINFMENSNFNKTILYAIIYLKIMKS